MIHCAEFVIKEFLAFHKLSLLSIVILIIKQFMIYGAMYRS